MGNPSIKSRLFGFANALVLASGVLAGAAHADPLKIVALGDSLTAGYELPEGQGLVPQLQAILDAQGIEAQLIDAARSGDTTSDGLVRMDRALRGDVDALVLLLGANDMLMKQSPATTKDNLSWIINYALGKDIAALLVGVELTEAFRPENQGEFDVIYDELSESFGVMLHDNLMGSIVGLGNEENIKALMLEDGLHPNAQGVALMAADLGQTVEAWIAGLDD